MNNSIEFSVPFHLIIKMILTRRFSRFFNITVREAKIIHVYQAAKI
jgi:hypothetical protein